MTFTHDLQIQGQEYNNNLLIFIGSIRYLDLSVKFQVEILRTF